MTRTFAYAGHGSRRFNKRLGISLDAIARDVRSVLGTDLVALILGGGYGRGEGGVVHRDGVECPYNDLDLVLVVQRKGAVPARELELISRRHESALGIHVDFSRPLTKRDVRHWPHTLMWQDLLNGHRVLAGPNDVLVRTAPTSLRDPLPPIEATRLLLNRGAGLLWAMRAVRGFDASVDADFVRRNFYKCTLALGDALLIAHGMSQTPYTGRDRRLGVLTLRNPTVAEFRLGARYREALRFKFNPDSVPPDAPDEGALRDLAGYWGAVFLHVEQVRARHVWRSLAGYCESTELREPGSHGTTGIARNLIRNAVTGSLSWKCPRERLYRDLPPLLGLVGPVDGNWDRRSKAFLDTWSRWN